MQYEDDAPPYALTRAQYGEPPAATRQPHKGAGTRLGAARRLIPGAMRVDRRSRSRGALDLCDVFLVCGIGWLAAGFSLGSNA
ncbi:hypothetical protein GCM10009097_16230 [Pigmentiphaga daeguensis]|uniref:Uncharacterized protein n=1 Tax=Pigmentiphaga daeguensis TaxID=414049 RepID=A0ABN1BLH7_9BURK